MEEVWKNITGYEGMYMVSNLGNVKSIRLDKEKPIKRALDAHGYLIVRLRKNGKFKNHLVHRLVAIEFCENVNNDKLVNHKDRNRENARADNLEWCDHGYNSVYDNANKRKEEWIRKIYKTNISKYDLEGNKICEYLRASIIPNYDNEIIDCCDGLSNIYDGYIWKYSDEETQFGDKEFRLNKVIVGKVGKHRPDSINYKVAIPKIWAEKMGLSEEDRNIKIEFDGEKIIIKKR